MELIICIYACDKVPRYKDQILKILETWGSERSDRVKILFFLGEEQSEDWGDDFIHLPGVRDDYISASYKQFLGIKYIHDHYPMYRFLLCIGTDAFPVIDRLLDFLKDLDANKSLYIGGHGCHRRINDIYPRLYYHSGGPGFLLSRAAVDRLYPILDTAVEVWTSICERNHLDLAYACDVAISYFVHQDGGIQIVRHDGFFHCNHHGLPCHAHQIDKNNIFSCHSMSLEDVQDFFQYLKNKETI